MQENAEKILKSDSLEQKQSLTKLTNNGHINMNEIFPGKVPTKDQIAPHIGCQGCGGNILFAVSLVF